MAAVKGACFLMSLLVLVSHHLFACLVFVSVVLGHFLFLMMGALLLELSPSFLISSLVAFPLSSFLFLRLWTPLLD